VVVTFALAGAGAGVEVASGVPFSCLYRPCSSMYCITGSETRYLTHEQVSFDGIYDEIQDKSNLPNREVAVEEGPNFSRANVVRDKLHI
jgi:hypothetical protein